MAVAFLNDDEEIVEKDSLFSEEEPEEVSQVETIVEEVEELKPVYTQEELEKLISFFKKITTLYDLKDSDWKEEHDEVITEFLMDPKQIVRSLWIQAQA